MQKHKNKNKVIQEEEEVQEEVINQDQENNQQEFHPIDILEEHGIASKDVKRLRESGFNSLEAVSYSLKKI